jgi:hypothetical protein
MHQLSTWYFYSSTNMNACPSFVHTAIIHSLSLEAAKYCFCNTLLSVCRSAVCYPHKTTELPSF